ncbi:MAG: DUF504 domain-containing protein [Candidatus Methanosuratus sp.]|nr:DUF504 domain-containing protein [Candidatus Methanosuratincola sp.]
MTTIREMLNRIRWSDEGGLSGYGIVIVHRGAPGNRRVIRGEDVTDIAPRAIICRDRGCVEGNRGGEGKGEGESEGEGEGWELVIPYHRVVALMKDGSVVWERGTKE